MTQAAAPAGNDQALPVSEDRCPHFDERNEAWT